MKKLQELMVEIMEWSDSAFGDAQRTVSIVHHLKKEVPELITELEKEIATGCDNSVGIGEYSRIIEKVKFEFADCFMLILDAASHFGLSAHDLIEVTEKKLEINRNRKWGKPDENGVVEHIRELKS